MCVCMCFYVRGCVCMCEHLQEFLVSQSLFYHSLPLSSYQSVILFSLHLFLYVVTPLHYEAPEGSVSRRGSGGFSPSLSPEDASTSC